MYKLTKCRNRQHITTTITITTTTTTTTTRIMKKPSVPRSQTFTFAQTIALAAFSASVGVLLTAVITARFALGPYHHNHYRHHYNTIQQYNVKQEDIENNNNNNNNNNIVNNNNNNIAAMSLRTIRHSPTGGIPMRATGGLRHVSLGVFNAKLPPAPAPAPSSSSSSSSSSHLATYQKDEGPWPKVIWLMSFPNSGTSYTLHLTRQATNATTATNYALEGDIRDEPSVPVSKGAFQGPFLELVRGLETVIPSKYILTKTHCGGYCTNCRVQKWIETPRSFEVSCRSGQRAYIDGNGTLTKQEVTYDQGTVAKAVHVIRDPLDNVVARFHLKYNEMKTMQPNEDGEDPSFVARYPNDAEGFAAWCKMRDARSLLRTGSGGGGSGGGGGAPRWVDERLLTLLEHVPCRDEFYRYVQWHNMAVDVVRGRNIPVHIIHYHNYSDNFEATLTGLLDFVELERKGNVEPFHPGKEYHSFYTQDERLAIKKFIQEFSSIGVWNLMKDYKF